ncbi:MAG: hypothetical protein ACJASM_003107 [Salibacteraceae bacterium]
MTEDFIQTVVDMSKYMEIANLYIDRFWQENVKIVLLDELDNSQQEVIASVADLLGVDVPDTIIRRVLYTMLRIIVVSKLQNSCSRMSGWRLLIVI